MVNFGINGEMRERLNRHAWKACVPNGTLGSNPSLSAILLRQDTFVLGYVGIGEVPHSHLRGGNSIE
jgi:hypothetical protein